MSFYVFTTPYHPVLYPLPEQDSFGISEKGIIADSAQVSVNLILLLDVHEDVEVSSSFYFLVAMVVKFRTLLITVMNLIEELFK